MKDNILKGFITTILLFAIIGSIWLIGQIQINGERRIYNNGVCYCGGHYEFISASTHKTAGSHSTTYIYMCDNCQNILELLNYFKKNA